MNFARAVAFIALVLSMFVAPSATEPQQAGKLVRIGVLVVPPVPPPDTWTSHPIADRLRELGYVEGRDFSMEYRLASGNYDRLPELAAQLVRAPVDLIVVTGNNGAVAALAATDTIPIVSQSCDPFTLVTSLARHGRNLTGVTCMRTELSAKRLEVLKEAIPKASRVALLFNPIEGPEAREVAEAAAKQLRITLIPVAVRSVKDVEAGLDSLSRQLPDALFVNPDAILLGQTRQIAEFALKHRLPAIGPFSEFVDVGGLMSYGATTAELSTRTVALVERIFTGAKPRDLPIEQATRFVLTINMRTARNLGLTIPRSVLLRADRVIE